MTRSVVVEYVDVKQRIQRADCKVYTDFLTAWRVSASNPRIVQRSTVHTMEYHSAIETNEVTICATICISLKNIVLRERSWIQKDKYLEKANS